MTAAFATTSARVKIHARLTNGYRDYPYGRTVRGDARRIRDISGLAIPPIRANIGHIMLSFGRKLVLALTLAILYSGPVAACICPDSAAMPEMPCCPDQPMDLGHLDMGMPPSLSAACGPVAVGFAPASEQKLPAPVAALVPPLPWHSRAPPERPTLAQPSALAHAGPPTYLATSRLRI
jgi:hypothetical protein